MTEPVFRIEHLQLYKVIRDQGTYKCNCASNIISKAIYDKDEFPRWLIPLRVIPEYNIAPLLELLLNSENVTYREASKYFITGAIFENSVKSSEELPVKGEEIICNFIWVADRLLCNNVTIIPRILLNDFNMSDYLDVKLKLNKLLNITDNTNNG